MVRHLAITKARTTLGEVVRRVHRDKEYVVLEKGGMPVAAIIDIDEFEDHLELQDPEVNQALTESREEYNAGKARPVEELLGELEHSTSSKTRARS